MKTFLECLEESDFQCVNNRYSRNELWIGYDTDEDEEEQQIHDVVFNAGSGNEIHVPSIEIDNAQYDPVSHFWIMNDEHGKKVIVKLYSASIIKREDV